MENIQQEIVENIQQYNFEAIFCMTDSLCEEWKQKKQSRCLKEKTEEELFWSRYKEPYLKNLIEVCHFYQINEADIKVYIKNTLDELNRDYLDLSRLVIMLGTKCSLRCKECNNLMPYFKPQKDLDIDHILNALYAICSKARTILKCELIGGEPFLSKNLKQALSFLLARENVYQVEITTNGTILPAAELVPLLQNHKVNVRISDYGDLVCKERLCTFLETNQIKYEILESGKWISSGGIEKRGREESELRRLYQKCYSGYICKTMYDEKMFACARAASLYALGCMEEEYLEINSKMEIGEIREFLLRDFSYACDYCDFSVDELKYVEPAEQM